MRKIPDFSSIKDLEKYLTETVFKSALEIEVADTVIKTQQKHIQSDVYDVYSPTVYERREDDGGLIDAENFTSEMISSDTLAVVNNTKPNPYARDGATTNKNLPELVEFGHGYNEYYYDYPSDPAFYLERPFTENTIKELEETKAYIKAFKRGLKREGVNSI